MVASNLLELLIRACRDYTSSKIETTQLHFSKAFAKCTNIQKYLNREYVNKITSKDIEQVFESNYDYLNRVFQKMTEYTIINNLDNFRINKAKDLFDTTPMKIAEVGYLVGIIGNIYPLKSKNLSNF